MIINPKSTLQTDFGRFVGRFVVHKTKWGLVVHAWPRRRGPAKSPAHKDAVAWFTAVQARLKQVSPTEVNNAITASSKSGWYPRDVLMTAMAGNLINGTTTDGTLWIGGPLNLEQITMNGARVHRTSGLPITAGSNTARAWQATDFDTNAFWNVGQPTRLTVPAGVTYVEVSAEVLFTGSGTPTTVVSIQKNGTTLVAAQSGTNVVNVANHVSTGPIAVIPGDYFEAVVFSSLAETMAADPRTWFSIAVFGTV